MEKKTIRDRFTWIWRQKAKGNVINTRGQPRRNGTKEKRKRLALRIVNQDKNKLKLTNKIQERRIQVNNYLKNQDKISKSNRIIASILLPIIMFIGIGMSISVFKSKTIIDGETAYMYTPFERGIGLLKIISKSGEDFKEIIDEGIEYEQELKQSYASQIMQTGQINSFSSYWKLIKNSLGSNTAKGIYQIGNILWYMIKEPFILTYRLVNYLTF